MTLKTSCRAICAAAFLTLVPATAHAQTTTPPPNYGDYQSLQDLFRIGVRIERPGVDFQDSFGLNVADQSEDFLMPDQLRARYPQYNDVSQVTGVLDFRGVEAIGSYAAGSNTFTLRVPAFDEGGVPYVLTFNGASRDASYQMFEDYVDEIDNGEAERLIRLLLKALARSSPLDPLAGNPSSLQGTLVRNALEMSSSDSVVEGSNTAGDPWIVGAAVSYSKSGRFNSTRYDARFQRTFRMFEGGRAVLKFDMPISYSEVNGARAATAQLGVGLEVPVIAQRWSLEPRIGYGITASDQLGSLGHMVSTSVASRYVINGLGRGRIVIGNMAGYTQTLSTGFTGYNINPGLKNWVFRNGLAYDLPLKMRAGGRGASIRTSYTFTQYAGDKLYSNNFHEAAISFGLRGREESQRYGRDLIRFNVSGLKARNFKSISAGVGFRF